MTEKASGEGSEATVLGFDYGLARIGVASCQLPMQLITPRCIVRARDGKPDWQHIEKLMSEWQPSECVVGLPRNMDDSDGPVTVRAQRFARQLKGRFEVAVHLVDERLTSIEALERHQEASKGKKADIDAIAACVIIETWLNANE